MAKQDIDTTSQIDFPWEKIGKIPVLPRIKLFIWKLIQKALPTSSIIGAHNPDIETICQMCNNQEQETEHHLFRECPFARALSFGFSLGNLNCSCTTDGIASWVKWWITDNELTALTGKISTILWFLWKYRCSVVFEKIRSEPKTLIDQINRFLESTPPAPLLKFSSTQKTNCSSKTWSKLNTD